MHYTVGMKKGYLHYLIQILWDAIHRLHGKVKPLELERMATMVHRVMFHKSRMFHGMEHVFGFLDSDDPVVALAAVFHDLVYLQVDAGLPSSLEDLLKPYLQIKGTEVIFLPATRESKEFLLCCTLFGREPLVTPAHPSGLNEFLSGFTFCLLFKNMLPTEDLGAVLLCIEATIPFRGLDDQGRGVGDVLEARAREAFPDASEARIQQMVHRAIDFANRDVGDFANPDTGAFLSNTWELLPETNYTLRNRGAFSIQEYRKALYNMLNFFRSLEPERVFHSYKGVPPEEEMKTIQENARKNLTLSIQYLRAKLLAASILEALSILTGGDAPMALFMGDLNCLETDSTCMIRFLPSLTFPSWLQEEHPVVRLLRDGRLEESSFDLRNSPFALWLYKRLRPEEWGRLSIGMERFFKGDLSPHAFLSLFPGCSKGTVGGGLEDILKASMEMVPTRREYFQTLLQKGLSPLMQSGLHSM